MDWKKYWNKNALLNLDNEIKQVQRKDYDSTLQTVDRIVKTLHITTSDTVLDLCCGNGIITQQISKKANKIVGVDQSEVLINVALNKHNGHNVRYFVGNCLEDTILFKSNKFDKIYLQFSFQYFTKINEGEKVIKQMLKLLNPNGKIFIGDIPNYEKKAIFYNTPIKKIRLLKDTVFNKNQMGKFWKVSEIDSICKKLGVKGSYIEQPKQLPYAHYRFDYLIEN